MIYMLPFCGYGNKWTLFTFRKLFFVKERNSTKIKSSSVWLYDMANEKEIKGGDPSIYDISSLPNPPPATISTKAENYDQNVPQT